MLSEEWEYIVKNYFLPKCEVTGFCSEKKSCGRNPKKEFVQMSKQFGKYQLKSRYKGDKKMRVKFSTVEEVQNFAAKAGTMESDITIHSGNRYIIDGKSLMGIFSLDLSSPLEIEFLEKKQGEEEEFTKFCKAVGVMAE